MECQTNQMNNQQDEKDDSGIEQDNSFIYIRISIEDHNLQKVLKFNLDDTIWNVKQKVLQGLIRELPDCLNYGLYLPASNGRAGKFLDESRCLKEYPFTGSVFYLEFKYKRRVYKSLNLVQKTSSLKINAKKFIDAIKTNQIGKVSSYLDRGFDPNCHVSDDETPLITACIDLREPRPMIMTLVNGGAHLDFRTRNGGLTPLHKSAIFCRKEALITLLELGASANVYDNTNLTPLYHLILNKNNESIDESSACCLLLLKDHSIIDCRDESHSTELHQACRLGLVQHVEHLLFYRADINSLNIGGNTPLHICAAANQESCARVLLYRGADTKIVNKSNKTAYELALLSQNYSVGNLIQSHTTEETVPFVEIPIKNPRRRSVFLDNQRNKSRARSSSNPSSFLSSHSRSQSMPKLNIENSLRQSQSPIIMPTIDNYFQHHSSRSSSPKSISDHGFTSESTSHLSSGSPNGTHPTNRSIAYKRQRLYAAVPGRKCVCIKSYQTNVVEELPLNKGDIVEILNVGEQGYLEGLCRNSRGWFPSNHIQDICVFKNGEITNDDTIVISRDALSALMINDDTYTPRTIVLQRGKKGFGFVLRGSRVAGKLFQPSPCFPALQFFDSIEKGSNAEKAGLKQHDYVLEINGVNVISMPHEECVQLIKRSGDTLSMKIVTANTILNIHSNKYLHNPRKEITSQSLTYRPTASNRPTLDQQFDENVDRPLGEYEYVQTSAHCDDNLSMAKQNNENTSNGSSDSIYLKSKPTVPERDSSLYECFTSCQNPTRFRPFTREIITTTTTTTTNIRLNSNSSSNEADEESSLSSLNSNQMGNSNQIANDEHTTSIYINSSQTSMSTFKTTNSNVGPSRINDTKKQPMSRKENCATLNSNNNNNISAIAIENETSISMPPPPPPPPLPANLGQKIEVRNDNLIKTKCQPLQITSDLQSQIEQAKNRLKKVNDETPPTKTFEQPNGTKTSLISSFYSGETKPIMIEDKTPSIGTGFPPPPSPTTLRRTINPSTTQGNSAVLDPRLDANFSAVIAQRAAESKARRHENPYGLEFNSKGLPPSKTFFNNHVTTNGVQTNSSNHNLTNSTRFSATANQLLENLKRRGGTTITTNNSFVKHYN